MRVAVDATSCLNLKRTGVARYAEELILALEPLLAESGSRMTIVYKLSLKQRHVHQLPPVQHSSRKWWSPRLPPLRRRYDLMHYTGLRFPRWRHPREVYTIHDLYAVDGVRFPDPAQRTRMLARYLEIARRAAAIICVSGHTAQILRGYLEESGVAMPAIHVIPLGVNPNFVPASEEQKREIRRQHDLQKPFFFFYGLPAENKNIDRLFQAFARRDSALADYELVIAGPAREDTVRDLRLRAAGLGIGANFRHIGRLAETELPVMLSTAAALTFPSLYEGFGLPIVEAMACGTPVLTSLGHATEEVAAGHATLVDPRDVDDIAAGLTRAVTTTETMRAGACEYARAMTWRRTAEQTVDVYRSVLA